MRDLHSCLRLIRWLLLLASTAPPPALAATFTVEPNGVDDTAALETAFGSCVASGPGCTVELTAGTFYLSRGLMVANFDGHFRGTGKTLTTIQNRPGVIFPVDPPIHDFGPGFFFFYQDERGGPRSLKISDMTFRAVGQTEAWSLHNQGPWHAFHNFIDVAGKVTGVEDFELSFYDSSLERVHFEGGPGDLFGRNIGNAYRVEGELLTERRGRSVYEKYGKPITGVHTIIDSSFTGTLSGFYAFDGEDSSVLVQGNSFDEVSIPIRVSDFGNSTIEISRNEIRNAVFVGILVEQGIDPVLGIDFGAHGPLPRPSSWVIRNNSIHGIVDVDGVGVIDYTTLVSPGSTLNAVVAYNSITLDQSNFGGIVGIASRDAVITGNQVRGSGLAGIYMGVFGEIFTALGSFPDLVSGWTLNGNNVENVEALVAPVWLGPGASGITVVGGDSKTNVFDQGTDNILVGVNNMNGNPPGPRLSRAMKRKMEILLRQLR